MIKSFNNFINESNSDNLELMISLFDKNDEVSVESKEYKFTFSTGNQTQQIGWISTSYKDNKPIFKNGYFYGNKEELHKKFKSFLSRCKNNIKIY